MHLSPLASRSAAVFLVKDFSQNCFAVAAEIIPATAEFSKEIFPSVEYIKQRVAVCNIDEHSATVERGQLPVFSAFALHVKIIAQHRDWVSGTNRSMPSLVDLPAPAQPC